MNDFEKGIPQPEESQPKTTPVSETLSPQAKVHAAMDAAARKHKEEQGISAEDDPSSEVAKFDRANRDALKPQGIFLDTQERASYEQILADFGVKDKAEEIIRKQTKGVNEKTGALLSLRTSVGFGAQGGVSPWGGLDIYLARAIGASRPQDMPRHLSENQRGILEQVAIGYLAGAVAKKQALNATEALIKIGEVRRKKPGEILEQNAELLERLRRDQSDKPDGPQTVQHLDRFIRQNSKLIRRSETRGSANTIYALPFPLPGSSKT